MIQIEFDKVVKDRVQEIKFTLVEKAKQYVRNENCMHNFDIGSNITGQSREKVLYGFLLKHLISFQDMVHDIESGTLPTMEHLEEKVGDIINYMILFEGSVKDKLQKKEKTTGFLNKEQNFKNTYLDLTIPMLNVEDIERSSSITHT